MTLVTLKPAKAIKFSTVAGTIEITVERHGSITVSVNVALEAGTGR